MSASGLPASAAGDPRAATTAVDAGPMRTAPARIRTVRRDLADTFTVTLDPPGGAPFSFEPGQFNMLYLYGVGEVAISISGDPANPSALVHTIREVGTVTQRLGFLKTGDTIGVRGPYGRPWPLDLAPDHDLVIVAGGLGLAPLRPALLQALHTRDLFRRIVLLYGARRPDDVLYPAELKRLGRESDAQILVTVDRAEMRWRGHVGAVTTLIPRATFDPARAVALVCGPEVMMRFTVRDLLRRGVPDTHVFVSMERNMKCGVGFCGHCQFGPSFVCTDGPVFPYRAVADRLAIREV